MNRKKPIKPGVAILVIVIGTFFFTSFMSLVSLDSGSNTRHEPTQAEIEAKKQQEAAELEAFKKTPAGQLCAKHPTWTKSDCEQLQEGNVWVGMTYDMLVWKRGKPDYTNVSNYGKGNRFQYCWTDWTPSCFYDKNGDKVMESYN